MVASIAIILTGLMQLIEYFLWKNQECSRNNHNLSLLIMILLASQVIVVSLLHVYLFDGTSKFVNTMIIAACLLYAFFTMYLVHFLNKMELCSTPSKNSCRLVWAPFKVLTPFIKNVSNMTYTNLYKFVLFVIFLTFYFFLFLCATGIWYRKGRLFEGHLRYPIRYAILPVTFIFACVYSVMKEGIHWTDVFGSFWCFNAVAFGVVSVLHI